MKIELDYERQSEYTLTVQATDSGVPVRTATVPLHILVDDVNDHAPVIQIYTVEQPAVCLQSVRQFTVTTYSIYKYTGFFLVETYSLQQCV